MKLTLVALVLLSASCMAHAQVFKCVDDKTKKITFSDVPCPKTASGGYVDVRPTNQFDGGHLRRYSAEDRIREQRREVEREIERQERRERDQIKEAEATREALMKPCRDAMNGRLDSRAARNKAAVLCGQPQTIDEPLQPPPVPRGPSVVSKCDANGCWGTNGERFNHRSGSADRYFGPNGQACRERNGRMICN